MHAVVFMVLSTLIWRYVPLGSSNFEGDEEYRRNCWRQYGKKHCSGYAEEPEEFKLTGAELFNQPDPSKMHAGVYH